jgi:hypothetical protein
MQQEHNTLNDDFKSLWGKDSPMQTEWKNLETLFYAIKEISHNLALRATEIRTVVDIDRDMQTGQRQMGQLLIETLFVLWNRVLLRACLKVRDSMELMFFSINIANAYGCALAARSIIEHVALLQYLVNRVPWRNNRVFDQETLFEFTKLIFSLTQGSTFDWDKLLSGDVSIRDILTSKAWKRPHIERIPYIADLVEVLDKELSALQGKDADGHIQFLYSALCDIAHPSWGGDFIYAPKMYRDIKVQRTYDEHFKRIATFFCLPMVVIVKHFGELVKFMMDNEPRMLATMKNE